MDGATSDRVTIASASRRGQATDSGRHHLIASRITHDHRTRAASGGDNGRHRSAHNLAGTRGEAAQFKRQKPHHGRGLLAPSPDAKIHADLAAALKDPVVLTALDKMGATPVGSSPKDFDAFMRTEAAKWEPVLKEANIKVQ